jgi:hypothetical protein
MRFSAPILLSLFVLASCGPQGADNTDGMLDAATADGLLVLIQDGETLQVAGSADGVRSATGSLWAIDEAGASSRGIDITADQVEVIAVFDGSFDLTARVPLTLLRINSSLLVGDTLAADSDYDLGPDGGTIWLTAIETKSDGSFRVRGQFNGQTCPVPDVAGNCYTIEGVFAFDQPELPDDAVTRDLVSPAP